MSTDLQGFPIYGKGQIPILIHNPPYPVSDGKIVKYSCNATNAKNYSAVVARGNNKKITHYDVSCQGGFCGIGSKPAWGVSGYYLCAAPSVRENYSDTTQFKIEPDLFLYCDQRANRDKSYNYIASIEKSGQPTFPPPCKKQNSIYLGTPAPPDSRPRGPWD